MEIVKNNFDNTPKVPKVRTVVCEHCKSQLRITESDVHSGNMMFLNEACQPETGYFNELVTCPCCGKETRPCVML